MPKIVAVSVYASMDSVDGYYVWYDNGNKRFWGGNKSLPATAARFISSAKRHETYPCNGFRIDWYY